MIGFIRALDFLILSMLFLFLLNILAIITNEDIGVFVTVVGATVTIIGYAFIRPIDIQAWCEQEVLNGKVK